MTPSFDLELWERLTSLRVDPPGAALPFLVRLAREQSGLNLDDARALWREYLRFLYLAVRAGHPVTPSGAVDAVWHLHLVYTQSYWEDLCPRVLGQALHHGPTRGGSREDERYREQYEATLRSYLSCFGEPAPARFWPPPARRFCDLPVTVDGRRHWILRRWTAIGLGALLIALGFALGVQLA